MYLKLKGKRIYLLLFFILILLPFVVMRLIYLDSNESLKEVNKLYYPETKEQAKEKKNEEIEKKIDDLENIMEDAVKKAEDFVESLDDEKKPKKDINTKVTEKENSPKTEKEDDSSWLDWWWIYLIGGWLVSKIFGGD